MTLDVVQIQEAQANPPVMLVVGELDQFVGDLSIFRRQTRLMAIAREADSENKARQLDIAPT